jgi:hypothetical protein
MKEDISDDHLIDGWMICDKCGCLMTGLNPGDKCYTPVKRVKNSDICTGIVRQAIITDCEPKKS